MDLVGFKKSTGILHFMPTSSTDRKVTLNRAALIARRAEMRLSQGALAAMATIDQAIISRAETGASNPSMAALARIASALEVDIAELLRPANGTHRQGVCSQCFGLIDNEQTSDKTGSCSTVQTMQSHLTDTQIAAAAVASLADD